MSMKRVLIEEFNDELENLRKIDLGTETYKATVDGVCKLADRITEIEKIEQAGKLEESKLKDENYFRTEQMNIDKRDRFVKNCIAAATGIGGLIGAIGIAFASMNFEKEGTFTSEAGRNAIRQLLRFK